MATMNQRLDSMIREIIKNQPSYFKKSGIVSEVVSQFEPLPRKNGIDVWEVFAHYVRARLERILGETDNNGLRKYECYADGTGERRWQPFRALDLAALRVCMAAREVQISGHERVLRLYQSFERELEAAGAGATVEQVYDAAVEAAS